MRFDFSHLRYKYGVNETTECDSSKMPSVQVHCMNIMDGNISYPINILDEYAGNSNAKINIIMIHNVESIAVKELRRLNFLFRVTDKSYIYANIVILLLWNTQSRPFTDEERRLYGVVDDVEIEANDVGSSISLRSFLAAEWSKSGPDVSGRALSGRITRTAFSAKEDLNPIVMDLSCSVIRDEVAKQKRAHEKKCTMMYKMMRLTRDMMKRFQRIFLRMKNNVTERINSFAKSSSFFSLEIYEPKILNGFVLILFLWIILVIKEEFKAINAKIEKLSTGGGGSATSFEREHELMAEVKALKAMIEELSSGGGGSATSYERENGEKTGDDTPYSGEPQHLSDENGKMTSGPPDQDGNETESVAKSPRRSERIKTASTPTKGHTQFVSPK